MSERQSGLIRMIGGPPRIGKTLLAGALLARQPGNLVSVDAIRRDIQIADPAHPITSRIDAINQQRASDPLRWALHYRDAPRFVYDALKKDSEQFWPGIAREIIRLETDGTPYVIEGEALFPHLVARLPIDTSKVIYLGNENPNHAQTMIEYAAANPDVDWLAGREYTPSEIRAFGYFISVMSMETRVAAEDHGFRYVDMSEGDFETIIADLSAEAAA